MCNCSSTCHQLSLWAQEALSEHVSHAPASLCSRHSVHLLFLIFSSCDDVAVALQEVLNSLKVSLGTSDTKFSAALGKDQRISVAGTVKGSQSYLTRVGNFDVDLSLQGIILLVRCAPHATAVWHLWKLD